jgi:hypothetical protein
MVSPDLNTRVSGMRFLKGILFEEVTFIASLSTLHAYSTAYR